MPTVPEDVKKAINKDLDSMANLAESLKPMPKPEPHELPLNEAHSIFLDLIKSKEYSAEKSRDIAKKTMEVADHEAKEVARLKNDLFRKVVVDLGLDTKNYNVKINSATGTAVLEPK